MASLSKEAILQGKLSSRFSSDNIILLDAGLGTTLEDVLHKDISHPLWSAHLVDSQPGAIIEAHLAFLKAGASIVLTATYQCAPETFARAGYTPENGNAIMHKAIRLAVQARDQHVRESPTKTPAPRIALSLGPYGATLFPAAEFTGIYPPPYGPSQPGTFFDAQYPPDNNQKEREAEDALVEFHLNRLRTFASLPATWGAIDIIAFESVPLLREARAIRRAMTLLANANPTIRIPPWWISLNFPDGAVAEQNSAGARYSAADAVRVCFEQAAQFPLSIPSAFGINCTHIKHIRSCLQTASKALEEFTDAFSNESYRMSQSQLGFQGGINSVAQAPKKA
ncbi:AdoMet-homocysteine methyltransferase [Ceratobasidium sp. 370]|nr:AdoMet-homocysteine methyltransferase [Ceratobasidium sp. 370]